MQSMELLGSGGLPSGFGATEAQLAALAVRLYEDGADITDIAAAMDVLSAEDRERLAEHLITVGVAPQEVRAALSMAKSPDRFKTNLAIFGVLSTLSMAVSLYHGYARNNSLGWGLWWGLMGTLFPVATPVVALAQCKRGPEKRFMFGCQK